MNLVWREQDGSFVPATLFDMEQDIARAERIAAGDGAAFKDLFDEFGAGVLNLCYAMVRDRFEAEDIAQEVFVEVFCSIRSYRGDSKLSTWIYRIAVNKSINFIRKQKVRRLFAGRERKVLENATSEGSDWRLRENEYKGYFEKALTALPEKQRTAFVLYMYEELPQKEIAEIMKCSLSSVEVLVHRARKSMEKYITSLDRELLK